MTAQTVYSKELTVGLAGQIYDMGNTDIDSYAAFAVPIPFGVFVSRVVDKVNQISIGSADSIGVSVRTASENELPAGVYDGGEYAIGDTVGVLREGYIWAQFDAIGGVIGDAVTINANGIVDVAGAATALTAIKAVIERPAVNVTVGGDGVTGIFVGLVKVYSA